MTETLYRRPLPPRAIAFSSPEGRALFAEALAAGGLDGYFPLAEQFHTQADPMFCGLGSLVMALNALAIDPGRLWKGPWRWFAEELLDCCVPPEEVRRRGLALDELACLARCNGADVEIGRPATDNLAAFRAALAASAHGDCVMIAAYDRAALGQTGTGHFSPIGGYHAARDLALVLDVARFKYPPHWVAIEQLWRATHALDPSTGIPRGWLLLRRRADAIALGYTLTCIGDDLRGVATKLTTLVAGLPDQSALAAVARAFEPLAAAVVVRTPSSALHRDALATARGELRALPAYATVAAAVGEDRAEGVLLLLLVVADGLPTRARHELGELTPALPQQLAVCTELAGLRAQLAALAAVRAS